MDADAPLPTDAPTLQGVVRELRAENAALRARVVELDATVGELRAELAAMKAKLDRATTHRFGRRSERTRSHRRRPPTRPRSGGTTMTARRSRFATPGQRVMPHGHFWVTIGDPTAPYTAFHFTTGYDAATGPARFLDGFRG